MYAVLSGQSQRSRVGTIDSLTSTPRAFTNAANKVSNVLRRYRKQSDSTELLPGVELGILVDREATTSANVTLCALRVVDELLHHFPHVVNIDDGRSNSGNPVTWRLLALINLFLHTGQSSVVIPHLFAYVPHGVLHYVLSMYRIVFPCLFTVFGAAHCPCIPLCYPVYCIGFSLGRVLCVCAITSASGLSCDETYF